MFFIIVYSNKKNIVSKKTFIFELIGYILFLLTIIVMIVSLKLEVTISFVLLLFVAILVITFGCITGGMYNKIKKQTIK